MNDSRTPTTEVRGDAALARLIAQMGVAGVAVMLASVALAVGGPRLALPSLSIDARTWALGAALFGALLLLLLQGLVLRQGERLVRQPQAAAGAVDMG